MIRLYRIVLLCFFCITVSQAWAQVSIESLERTLSARICPSNLETVESTVRFVDVCPNYKQMTDFFARQDCQHEAIRREAIINKYNEFVRKCRSTGTPSQSDIEPPNSIVPAEPDSNAGGVPSLLDDLLKKSTQKAAASGSPADAQKQMEETLLKAGESYRVGEDAEAAEQAALDRAAELAEAQRLEAEERRQRDIDLATQEERKRQMAAGGSGSSSAGACDRTFHFTHIDYPDIHVPIILCAKADYRVHTEHHDSLGADEEPHPWVYCDLEIFMIQGERYRMCEMPQ